MYRVQLSLIEITPGHEVRVLECVSREFKSHQEADAFYDLKRELIIADAAEAEMEDRYV